MSHTTNVTSIAPQSGQVEDVSIQDKSHSCGQESSYLETPKNSACNDTPTPIPNAQESNPKLTDSLPASFISHQNEEFFTFHGDDLLDFYDTSIGLPLDKLDIELGSDQIPLIQCSAHKLNLAIRGACVQHKTICTHLLSLNRFIKEIHKYYNLSRVYQQLHCRLRSENTTLWGSGFICLKSVKRAYLAGAFKRNECPVAIDIIESYLEVLAPAYIAYLQMQYKKTSISQIILIIRRVRNYINFFKR